ncbi:MAG: VOC family protein [Akkermansiaceae bacterium]|nr:VOC family protein [Akkermansiaceae bacterium]
MVDIGIVVKDLEKSARFYTEVLGLKEVKGFTVPADKTTRFGLADNQPATVRVFVLDETAGQPGTRLKIMSFPKAPGVQPDQEYIHSTLGLSYLTLFVTDMDRAVERLNKARVGLLGETPAPLGGGTFLTVVHDPDGNFIELIGPSK